MKMWTLVFLVGSVFGDSVGAGGTVNSLGTIENKAHVSSKYSGDVVIVKIDGQSVVDIIAVGGGIRILEKIDGQSTVTLNATNGIDIHEKIDGQSKVTLRSSAGDVVIGDSINGQSHVCAQTRDKVRVGKEINGRSTLTWSGSAIEGPHGVDGNSSVINGDC